MRVSVPSSLGMLYPEPATLRLAGRYLRAVELRLRDIGSIERAVALVAPNPLLGLARPRKDDPPSERTRAIRAMFRAAETWPPRLGSRAFDAALATGEGTAAYLYVALRRLNKRLDLPTVVEIAGGMSAEEWDALDRVAWGVQAWEAPERADREAGDRPGIDWGKSIDRIAVRYKMSYREIGNLYLSQYLNIVAEGEPRMTRLAPPVEDAPHAP